MRTGQRLTLSSLTKPVRRHVCFHRLVIGVDVARGIEVDEDFDLGKGGPQRMFLPFNQIVRCGYCKDWVDFHVELREVVRTGIPRPEVVDTA